MLPSATLRRLTGSYKREREMKIKGRLIEKRKASAKMGGQDRLTGETMIKIDYIHTHIHTYRQTDISIIVIASTVTCITKMLIKTNLKIKCKVPK